jgi:putative tryptophan/tyrosine transport system substrate-binding protein
MALALPDLYQTERGSWRMTTAPALLQRREDMKLSQSSLLKAFAVFLALILLAACQSKVSREEAQPAPGPRIAIVFTEPHPVLSSIIDAFKTSVRASMPNAVFTERHGSGSKAQYPAVVRAALAEKPALLVSVTTPISIEALKQSRGKTPLLFLGVTDPVGAEIVKSLSHPELSSGVSDNPPMEGVIDILQKFLPAAKGIGIPYDPKDQPAVATAERTSEIAKRRGMQVELLPVTSEAEIRASIRALAGRSDAIVIGMDNLFMKNAGITARTAMEASKPVFAADDKSVEMGALGGVGVNYADVGRIGGEIAIRVLRDKVKIGEIPVASLSTGDVFYNAATAKSLGLQVPQEIAQKGRSTSEKN